MHVIVNPEICRGCGVCESIAPDLFILRDEMFAHVIMHPVPEKLRYLVEEAIAECPENAISIIEEE